MNEKMSKRRIQITDLQKQEARGIHKEVPIEKWFHKIVNNPQNRIVWKELIIN